MVREYGIYQQGAMFTREDFDPHKTIKYLFNSYEIELSEKLAEDIKNNKVSDEDFDYICKELEITPDERTLQSIVIHALINITSIGQDGSLKKLSLNIFEAMVFLIVAILYLIHGYKLFSDEQFGIDKGEN